LATPRKTSAGKWELPVQHRLIGKRRYFTFDDEASAIKFDKEVHALLRAGIVPPELLSDPAERSHKQEETVFGMLGDWLKSPWPTASDREILALLKEEVGAAKLSELNYAWVEAWVARLKLEQNLAPSTIRKRVGALSRAITWWATSNPTFNLSNPILLLPKRYSSYTTQDAKALRGKKDKRVKVDVERDRRMLPGEFERIMAALNGEKREDKERPLDGSDLAEFRVLFLLIYYTGMRLREAYTMRSDQVDLERRTLRVRTSKQKYGEESWRDVPIRRELLEVLEQHLAQRKMGPRAPLVGVWDGSEDADALMATTNRLSRRFAGLFAYAQCDGMTEHDLRHEATCQWYEMRNAQGQWRLRDVQIAKIMGWGPGSTMPARYASFRAEDMASAVLDD
jgi:integrase